MGQAPSAGCLFPLSQGRRRGGDRVQEGPGPARLARTRARGLSRFPLGSPPADAHRPLDPMPLLPSGPSAPPSPKAGRPRRSHRHARGLPDMPSPCDASQGGSGRQQPTEVGAAQRDVLVAHRPSTKPEGGSHSRRTAAASFPRPFLACPVGRGALAKTGEAAWRRGARWLPTLADHGARPSPSRDCPASRPARSPTPPTPKRGEAVGRYRVAVPLPDPIRRGVRPLARPCCRTRPSCSPPPRVGAVARHGGPSLRLPSSGPGPGRRSGRSPSSALHCSGGQRFAAVVRSPWRRRSPCPHRSRWWVVGAPWSVLMSPGLPKGRRGDRSRACSRFHSEIGRAHV